MTRLRSVAAVGTAGVLAATLYALRRRRLGSGFKATRIPCGRVAAYRLTGIERSENIMCHGLKAFSAVDTGEQHDLSFEQLLQRPNIVLYAYDLDQQIFVFMEVDSKEALWKEPFLDRGVRKLASGAVYVCTIETAETYCKQHKDKLPDPENDTYLFVWNTGRCGSTLLARLTSAVGCSVTLSEPDWVDQLAIDRPRFNANPDEFQRLVWLLHTLDFQLAKTLLPANMSGKVIYSLNPKGSHGFLRDPVTKVFPNAKHVFMYRDLLKVVESFGSIFAGRRSTMVKLRTIVDNFVGGPGKMPKPSGPPTARFCSAMMKECFSKLKLPSGMFPKMLGTMWLDAVAHWMEFREKYVPASSCLTLRMDEFLSKGDLAKREAVVREVLSFSEIPTDDATVAKGMAVFATHSQAGTAMEKSSAKTGNVFLTEQDRQELTDMCVDAPLILIPGKIIPGSVGTKS